MPQPHLRTRSKKRLKVTLSGGKSRTHYKKEMASTSSCYMCGQPIAGVEHLTTAEMRKLNRSRRRIWRPHGGNLCHNCLKTALRNAARNI